mgnify:CR=1 FL=1
MTIVCSPGVTGTNNCPRLVGGFQEHLPTDVARELPLNEPKEKILREVLSGHGLSPGEPSA